MFQGVLVVGGLDEVIHHTRESRRLNFYEWVYIYIKRRKVSVYQSGGWTVFQYFVGLWFEEKGGGGQKNVRVSEMYN